MKADELVIAGMVGVVEVVNAVVIELVISSGVDDVLSFDVVINGDVVSKSEVFLTVVVGTVMRTVDDSPMGKEAVELSRSKLCAGELVICSFVIGMRPPSLVCVDPNVVRY